MEVALGLEAIGWLKDDTARLPHGFRGDRADGREDPPGSVIALGWGQAGDEDAQRRSTAQSGKR